MSLTKPRVSWKTIALPTVGIIAFIIYLYLFQVDIPQMIATIQQANPVMYFAAALLVFTDVFFFSEAWRLLLKHLEVRLSIFKAYLYVWYGIFMDIIIPAESISSEVSRLYLTAREYGNHVSGKVLASMVAHRLINMCVGLFTLMLGLGMLLVERQLNALIFNLSLFLISVTMLLAVLLLLLCIKEHWTLQIIDFLLRGVEFISRGRWKPTRLRNQALKLADMFHCSMKEFGRAPKIVVSSAFLTSFSWLSYLALSYTVFLALGFNVPWSVLLVAQSIVSAVKSIPIGVPFEVGLPEITMTTLYSVLGVPFELSAASTILNRILTLWLRFFVGFIVQQWFEFKKITFSLNAEGRDNPKFR